jgi:hypothetical protein
MVAVMKRGDRKAPSVRLDPFDEGVLHLRQVVLGQPCRRVDGSDKDPTLLI